MIKGSTGVYMFDVHIVYCIILLRELHVKAFICLHVFFKSFIGFQL